MDHAYYLDRLYPLQDRVLHAFDGASTGFYLGGGTAASRAYLKHRYSDDLDLFVNDQREFGLWAQRLVESAASLPDTVVELRLREERFVRFDVTQAEVVLKIELINDVPAHVGEVVQDRILGRVDSAENIFANKITAVLDRNEPKDLADIWGFTQKLNLSVADAIGGARSKAAGVFEADLARVLLSACDDDWSLIRWSDGPSCDRFVTHLHALGESLLLSDT